MRNIGVSIAGITFIILMIKIGTDSDNKAKYIKLIKHLIIATILIFISLTLIEIPKTFFGDTAEITGGETEKMTIGKIEDKDCDGRETVDIDGKRYVVTRTNVKLTAFTEKSIFTEYVPNRYGTGIKGDYNLENCSILKSFSECQGTFKGFFANAKYYRDADNFIFPVSYSYAEYIQSKSLSNR